MNRIRLYFRRRRQIRQLKKIKKNAKEFAYTIGTASLQGVRAGLHEKYDERSTDNEISDT